MSKAIRIKTTPNGGDKYVKIKLEQDFDFLEILSLNINQEDVYKRFSSDYGVIVGRVVINGGFGVPNAKVSVFIPLDDVDKLDSVKRGLYPFEKVLDKNSDGIRYNLLSKDSASVNPCFTPVGTFPSKREVLDNDTMLEVYCKYYKFTTTTNFAGDFMLFGVPLGTYTVHVDADISDIGIASQRPYDMISKGAPISRFDSTTKFSSGKNLDKLVQIKSLDSGVDVQPFWGDLESYEIGISRLDLDLNYEITPSAIFMGSIFGDKDKHSINRRCAPRKKLGQLNEQVTSEGTIRMIRKTINNQIEEFNVDGSELIDEFGAWAYQIPMNLDYMITDEVGNLILSQDPNKGVPTRARVRFNIGMENFGGESRVKTRARYLVPNNPKTKDDIDYEFGVKTQENSFRDIHWNKIYTVSNFISRFQRKNAFTSAGSRNATAIKDVDGAEKQPFPYNKVNTETNALFFIICLIMYIIIVLIFFMNNIIFPIINFILGIIKGFFKTLCRIKIWKWRPFKFACKIEKSIKYIPCITVLCPSDDGYTYAPGCRGGSRTFSATCDQTGCPTYYSGDNFGHRGIDCGLGDCVAFSMARTLNLFQFDFYNDWINGSLFSFLLKYRKRRNKQEQFCEYNCDDLAGGGVDGNANGKSDNRCYNNVVLDTCFRSGKDSQKSHREVGIREGLIKKVGGEFYYAATDKSANIKLFSTDLISLGSVFECDWQGIPKIQKQLINTTYKIPPDTQELTDNQLQIETSGMVDIGGNTCGNFFDVNCAGLHTNARQCLNIRHICEMGVDIDQAEFDAINNDTILNDADCIIGVSDIDDNMGKWFRDVFYGLNNSTTPWIGQNSLNIPSSGFSTNFNLLNEGNYNQTSTTVNGTDYVDFRNYSLNNAPASDGSFGQPDHSYYFYFGLQPGNSGLDKMNKKFFSSCIKTEKNALVIESNSTPDIFTNGNGCVTFSIVGGTGPFNYTLIGVNTIDGNPLNITPITGTIASSGVDVTICGLSAGTYSISVIDALGTPITDTITVNGPTPLYCYVSVLSNATSVGANDGSITITNVGGGIGVLNYELINSAGVIIQNGLAQSGLILNGLAPDMVLGYTVRVFDSGLPISECITTGLTVNSTNILTVSLSGVNSHCFAEDSGELHVRIIGGYPPYDVSLTGPNGYENGGSSDVSGLTIGFYTATVVDSVGSAATATITLLTENPELVIVKASPLEAATQNDNNNFHIPFYVTQGLTAGPANVEYSLDDGNSWIPYPTTYVNGSTPMFIVLSSSTVFDSIEIRFWVDYFPRPNVDACYSDEISYEKNEVALPPVALGIRDGLGSSFTPELEAIYQNKKQCNPNIGTYTFSINQLDMGYTNNTPYTVYYQVENGPFTNFQHTSGLITLTGPRNTTEFPSNVVSFKFRIKDTNGNWFPLQTFGTTLHQADVILPTAAMSHQTTTTGNSSIGFTHNVIVNGGIYTSTNPLILTGYGPIVAGQTYVITDNSPVYVNTAVDNNGCVLTIIG